MELELIGLDQLAGKKERQQKREEKKKEKEEKKDEKKKEKEKKKDDKKAKKDEKKRDRAIKKGKRGGSRAKKFFLAPARAAFFLLMKINFLKLRSKLREGWKKDKSKIEKGVIQKFGFKRENFLKELNRKESESLSSSFGVADPASAAAVAQSTPILIQVASVLSALGISAGAIAAAKNTLTGKDKELADEFTEGVEGDSNLPPDEKESGGGQSPDDFKEKPEINQGGGAGLMTGKMPLIIGLGAAALLGLYFLNKKK
jgi:hypothetical protein